ncbi:uncharacterized protein LOC62_03G004184 [Vanrija pseudolonga]|uniref:WSC domain-containing protein n=1 Tax=Vanrija pseudolonga TaxID=143232 RepID=A0AAF0Y9J9_9TREE|nr:hypothetical protein LOC62_03G004184 [Vanrija pseudolonga]
MHPLTFLLGFLLAATNVLAISNKGTPCQSACGDWSDVVKYCYQVYTNTPNTRGYEYSNQFLGCICSGNSFNGTLGNDTMVQSSSVCQSCTTTPPLIKKDLSTFLTLCAIQKQNGSAANATEFAPLVYVTNTDPTISGAVKSAAGATSGASHKSAAWATSAPAVGAAAFGALSGLSLLAASALFVL